MNRGFIEDEQSKRKGVKRELSKFSENFTSSSNFEMINPKNWSPDDRQTIEKQLLAFKFI